jgi:hypothetical protein
MMQSLKSWYNFEYFYTNDPSNVSKNAVKKQEDLSLFNSIQNQEINLMILLYYIILIFRKLFL